jgi:hypothetical protein
VHLFDSQLLYLKYDDESDGSVNYVSFCRDVDATETFSDRSFERDVHRDDTFVGGFRSPKVEQENRTVRVAEKVAF